MDRTETIKILAVLKANYINTFKDMSREEGENILNLWSDLLADVSYDEASYAIKYFIANDTKGFPPTIGNIRDIINKTKNFNNGITETEAWAMIYKAICNSAYNSVEEFNKLPKSIQRAIGNPDMLKSWSQLNMDEVNTVIQSNVMRSFKVSQKQEKEYEVLPQSVKEITLRLSNNTKLISD